MNGIPDRNFVPKNGPELVQDLILALGMEQYGGESDTDFTARVERVAMSSLRNEKDSATQRDELPSELHVIAYWSADRKSARVVVFRYKKKPAEITGNRERKRS